MVHVAEEALTMKPDEQTVAGEGDEEELRHDRLMALLHDLVRKHGGRRGAAGVLGIDRRTVAACMDGRGMSWRMREALERGLQEGAGSAAARQRKRNAALERRVDALEKELHEGLDAVRDGIEKLREDEARRWESLERRLARREAPRESTGSADVLGVAARGPEKTPAATRPAEIGVPKRLYPELVTKEPAPDDEEVYGEAWPLIEEWRRLWKTHSAGGRGQGTGVAGGRGARPGAGSGNAGTARADAAAGDDAPDGPVAELAAELAQGDPSRGPKGGGLETVGEANPHPESVAAVGAFRGRA